MFFLSLCFPKLKVSMTFNLIGNSKGYLLFIDISTHALLISYNHFCTVLFTLFLSNLIFFGLKLIRGKSLKFVTGRIYFFKEYCSHGKCRK